MMPKKRQRTPKRLRPDCSSFRGLKFTSLAADRRITESRLVARYAKFLTSTWKDPDMRSLSPNAKIVYFWLFTNESCGISGLYRVDMETIRFETGLKKSLFERAWHEVVHSGKVWFDKRTKTVWVVGKCKIETAVSGRSPTKRPSEKTVAGAVREILELEPSSLIDKFLQKYKTTLGELAESIEQRQKTMGHARGIEGVSKGHTRGIQPHPIPTQPNNNPSQQQPIPSQPEEPALAHGGDSSSRGDPADDGPGLSHDPPGPPEPEPDGVLRDAGAVTKARAYLGHLVRRLPKELSALALDALEPVGVFADSRNVVLRAPPKAARKLRSHRELKGVVILDKQAGAA